MSRATRIVGIGQVVAGDDGVGLAVLDELERRGVPAHVALERIADAMDLVALIEAAERLVLIDAVLVTPAGQVIDLRVEDLSSGSASCASSHGFGVARALELGQVLYPSAERDIRIVAITIDEPVGLTIGLTGPVADAVPVAAARVLELVSS